MNVAQLLETAREAALQAGKAIMKIYATSDSRFETKKDMSPLTLADTTAHTVISLILKPTGLPILSEESSEIPFVDRKDWNEFWLVDPMDGTREFIKRTGEFTVNIALIRHKKPIAGIIYAPCTDVLYCGAEGTGVYKTDHRGRIRLPGPSPKKTLEDFKRQQQVTIAASRSHMNKPTTAFIGQFPGAKLTSMGSSLKLMLVAEGIADIYPRLAPTMEWDTAAGHAILRALGKDVYQAGSQTELSYNKEQLLNPSFIAY